MSGKLAELREKYFPGKADALWIENSVNRKLLLGFSSSAGTLLVLPEKAYFIIDFRYIEAAKMQIRDPDCEVILQEKLYEQADAILKRHGVKTVGIEDDRLTVSDFAAYRKRFPEMELVTDSGLCEALWELRIVKTPAELQKINAAQELTDAAFSYILGFISDKVTEKQIALELEYQMRKLGADGIAFDTIAVAGMNSSRPHGVPSDYQIQKGDFITMDFGAIVDGYHSDMTRTVALGQVSEEQKRVYDTVLTAQKMALDAVAAGKVCSDIDQIARDYIYAQGYEGCFGHGLGHGVGLEIHEEPRFSPACHEILRNDMVITVEPGIYLEGKFGVRIEDFVAVKGDGCLNFTKSPKELIQL